MEFLISLNVLCLSKLSSKVLFFPTMILTSPIFLGEFYIQPRRGPKDGAHLHCEPETVLLTFMKYIVVRLTVLLNSGFTA